MNLAFTGVGDHIPDLPPSQFDLSDVLSDDDQGQLTATPPSVSEVVYCDDAKVKNLCIRIARAMDGKTESRLIAQSTNGHVSNFVLQEAVIAPYSKQSIVLQKKKPTDAALTEKQAIAMFEQHLAKKYPPATLRGSIQVATYQNLK